MRPELAVEIVREEYAEDEKDHQHDHTDFCDRRQRQHQRMDDHSQAGDALDDFQRPQGPQRAKHANIHPPGREGGEQGHHYHDEIQDIPTWKCSTISHGHCNSINLKQKKEGELKTNRLGSTLQHCRAFEMRRTPKF